jgi:hypothetical protein
MPVERQRWYAVLSWDALNAKLKRIVDVLDGNDRHDVREVSASETLNLTKPRTHVRVTTTGGSVTLTLPSSGDLLGFEFTTKKLTAANTVTLDAAGSELIDGAGTLAWTTALQSFTLRAVSGGWDVV